MISEKIANLRKQRGLTQADMAEYLQISRQAYSFYEQGKNEMDLQALCKLADFYNVTTDYLLGRYDTKPFLIDNEDEITLVKDYRILDERGKGGVRATLAFELGNASKDVKKSAM